MNRSCTDGLGIRHVVVGEDYGFGKNRCGNVESLTRLCSARGIGVTAISPVGLHALYGKYGSTEIRKALQEGDVFHAQHMLSRPWRVDGIVKRDSSAAARLTSPRQISISQISCARNSASMLSRSALTAKTSGVPAWPIRAAAQLWTAKQARLEVHLLDFDRDLYGQLIDVRFRSFIRAEKKFESFDELKMQIAKDADGARAILSV